MSKEPISARDYIRRETAMCIGINVAIGLILFLLLFGRTDPVPIWGMGRFAFDFLLQAFMIALMSVSIPGLGAARKMQAGMIEPYAGVSGLPRAPVLRALLLAIGAVILAGGSGLALFWIFDLSELDWMAALIIKISACGVIPAIVTPLGLRAALSANADGGPAVRASVPVAD